MSSSVVKITPVVPIRLSDPSCAYDNPLTALTPNGEQNRHLIKVILHNVNLLEITAII